jgi:DNA-binding SARP family transcriptional activator/serine/threonine protein kinase/WD40 repeat protein
MDFGVLGPLKVTTTKTAVDVGGPRQRRLLSALVANANQVVSTDRLIDIVFEGEPSAGASATIRTYIARLRRSLGDAEPGADEMIVTEAPGYRLEIDVSHVDAACFEAAIETGRRLLADNEAVAAVSTFRKGLELWRGEAYAEFAYEDWARTEVLRLDELKVIAAEELNEALLACGLTQDVVFETKQLIREHVLRDRLRAQLALALYRSGRQAEALRSLERYRTELGELGLEPGDKLVALGRAIAAHDPSLRLDAPAGQPLRGYRLGTPLGEGRYGLVYRAVQPGVGREVAIKTIRAQFADHPDFIRRFDAEAQLVANLEHPHIVPIYDYWREPGGAYIVMRLVPENLEDRLADGPMDVAVVGTIAQQLGGALAAAHDVGVIHGDIKPSNVLVDQGDAYLADFGVATLGDGTPIGDADYPLSGCESPEVLAGQRPGMASDQFALAVVLTQMLTGRLPFGTRAIATEHDRTPAIHVQRPSVPAMVDDVVWRATAWKPQDRHPTVTSFVESFTAALAGGTSAGTPSTAVANPYKGLEPFTEADGGVFFGRKTFVDELAGRLRMPGIEGRFIAIVGASGSGKSSVVRAGLLPQLRAGAVDGSDQWFIATMVPGSAPFAELEGSLRSVSVTRGPSGSTQDLDERFQSVLDEAHGDGAPLLLVIDQLEELFTQVSDEDVRGSFLRGLTRTLQDPSTSLRVVTTLRADFYDRPLRYHGFAQLMKVGTIPLVGMSAAQLEETVTQPAAYAGVEVEAALATQLVTDVIDQPAALPLLEFSLAELFDRRRGSVLTLKSYGELGGVDHAVAARAESVYAGLSPGERDLARTMFLRLVTVDESHVVGSKRSLRHELVAIGEASSDMGVVIDAFGAARLLVFDRDQDSRAPTVEIAHEALIEHWPRLAEWISDAGDGIRIQRQVEASARLWAEQGRQDADLYRGLRLESAAEWAAENPEAFSRLETEFVDASLRLRAQETERERRVNRRLRRLLTGVGIALAVALLAGLFAFIQGRRAESQALAAAKARGVALAAAATNAVDEDRSLALLLAVEAQQLDWSPPVVRAVLGSLVGTGGRSRTEIPTPAPDYNALTVNPEQTIAAARRGDGSIDIVDLVSRSILHEALPGPPRPLGSLSIDPSGTWVTSAGDASSGTAAIVYDVLSGGEVLRKPPESGASVYGAEFAPDGDTLAIADDTGLVTVYATGSWAELRRFDTGLVSDLPVLAYSRDGSLLYLSGDWGVDNDTPANLYALDAVTGQVVAGPAPVLDNAVLALAVGDDGTVYAAAEQISRHQGDTLVSLDPIDARATVWYSDLAISQDGRVLAGGPVELQIVSIPSDGSPNVERIDTPSPGVEVLAEPSTFLTAQATGSLFTWMEGPVEDLGTPLSPVGPGFVTLSPDGTTLAVWAFGRGVQLFDVETLQHAGELAVGSDMSILGIDFSSDGTRLAVVTCPFGEQPECSASLTIWDVDARRALVGPAAIGPAHFAITFGVAFTADDSRVASVGDGMRLWDATSLTPVGAPRMPTSVSAVASDRVVVVSGADSEGRSRLTATNDTGQTFVWEWSGDRLELVEVLEAVPATFLDDGTLVTGIANGPFVARDPESFEPIGPVYRAEAGPMVVRDAGPRMLVSSGGPMGVELWERGTGEPMSGLLPFAVSAVAPDGETLYLGAVGVEGLGREVRALSLLPEDLRTEACRRAGRNLTGGEWRSLMGSDEPYRVTCPQWPDARDVG